MERENIEAALENLLQHFSSQFTRARNYKSIPRIEMDLMMQTIRDLYEELQKLNDSNSIKEKVVATVSADKMNNDIETVVHVLVSNSEDQPEALVNESPKAEIAKEDLLSKKKENPLLNPEVKTKPKSAITLFDESATVASNYIEQPSLHNKIAQTKTERLSDKLQQQPLSDLKKSIGINEKFAFANELFEGNMEVYNQKIDELNNLSSYQEARKYLIQLADINKWNVRSHTYHELDELVKRRFGV